MIGSSLAHYRILAKLGSGGMGEVYLAEDTKLDRKVALKVLPANLTTDPTRLARLSKEAKTLAALSHPNIVTVYSVEEAVPRRPDAASARAGQSEPLHFITMELIEGRTLAEAIPEGGMAMPQLFEIAVPLAEALAAAHEKGIVHRDLKPSNVMLTAEGRVKVLDFGLAKQAEGREPAGGAEETTQSHYSLTAEHAAVGTAPYMSPEQIRGDPLDHRSDIFALGIVLYQMATGRRPFCGDTAADIASTILRDEPTPPTTLRALLPEGLGRVIRRCLEKDPRKRFQSTLDVSHELEDLATPPPRPASVSRAVGMAGVLLVGLAAAFALRPDSEPPPTDSGPSPIRSIAVLPFANLAEDDEQAYFVAGVQEALINDLSKIESLRVTSRTSTLRYSDTTASAPEIARALGVDALVEGSVLRVGNEVRITAQVIRGETDAHLWSASYDREIDNVLVLLSEVAASIVEEIEIAVTPRSQARLARTRRVVPEAHEALMRGRHALNRFDRAATKRALGFFQEAVRLDPTFADAHASVGSAHMMLGFIGGVPPTESARAAEDAVEKALELDPDNSPAYTTRGWVDYLYRWDFEAAERSFARALELNPSEPHAYHGLGDLLAVRGDFEGSLEKVRITSQLDPLSEVSLLPLLGHLTIAGRYDEAMAQADEILKLFPQKPQLLAWKRPILWASGRHEEAIASYRESFADAPALLRALDRGYEQAGPEGALQLVGEELERRFDGRNPGPMRIASYFARAGDRDRAFHWVARAHADRDPSFPQLAFMPDYTRLRSDPRYAELLSRIGVAPRAGANRQRATR